MQAQLSGTACERCIAAVRSVNVYARAFTLYSHAHTEVQERSQSLRLSLQIPAAADPC